MDEEAEERRYQRLKEEGYAAFGRGRSNTDNPYSMDGDIEAWNDGWMEALDDRDMRVEGYY